MVSFAASAARTRTAVPALLAVSLVLTGAASLIYQVAWFRTLGLVFGVTVQATSAVLAAFMGGLALGSLLAAAIVGRLRSPLRAYGGIELAIGLIGLVSLAAFDSLTPLYRSLAAVLSDPGPARFVLAIAGMLVPTTLMGATLPIVIAGLGRGGTNLVSTLYAANTAGAILGAAGAAFLLIGTYGLTVTVVIAAALNVSVGAIWLLIGGGTAAEPDRPAAKPDRTGAIVLAVYGVSGAAALAGEVVWTRVLAGIYPGTVYAFALMLAVVLLGIAAGSWAMAPIVDRPRDWLAVFAAFEVLIALGGVWSVIAFGQAYRVEVLLRRLFGLGAEPVLGEPWFMALFALIAIGPVSFALGLTFPVAARVHAGDRPDAAQRVGQIYGVNTIGGIAGSLLAGLVILPAIGAQQTLWLLAAVNLVGAAALALIATGRRWPPVIGGAAVLVAAYLLVPDIYRSLSATDPRGDRLVWMQEGQDTTVSVLRASDSSLNLRINSDGQGSDRGTGLLFHYELGHFGPLLSRPAPKVLVVGLGVGATAGAAAVHPDAQVTVVELHPGVLDAARLFDHANYRVLDRPNVRFVVNDARNYLLLTQETYDVIVADPILPTNAGAANLYSADYYRLARGALREGGVMVQWVNPNLTGYAYRLMIRTFLEAFPEATLWQSGSILVGSTGPVARDRQAIAAKFGVAEARDALSAVGLTSADDVLRRYTAGPAELAAYVGEGPIISDREPWIEYFRSLPDDGRGTSAARSLLAAGAIRAAARPGDAIVYDSEAVRQVMADQHRIALPSYTPPPGASDSDVRAAIDRLGARRIWLVPFPGRPLADTTARLLGTPTSDEQYAEVRVLRYDR